MTIKMPEKLEKDLKAQAKARGISVSAFVCEVLSRNVTPISSRPHASKPVKAVYGRHTEYGPTHPEHEIYPKPGKTSA
jgi:hypothetical protein